MDSEQLSATSEKNIQAIELNENKDCTYYWYDYNLFLNVQDKEELDSKESKLVFDFIEKIIKLTSEFWSNLAIEYNLKYLLREKNVRFSIANAENCKVLNLYNNHINYWFLMYQKGLIGKPNHCASFYMKRAFERLEEFLTSTLPLFEENITRITFNILKKNEGENFTAKIYNFENAGNYVNERLLEYLNRLHNILSEFHPKSIINQIKKNYYEEEKEISEINQIKQRILSQIENSYEIFGVFLGIPKNECISITEESSGVNLQTASNFKEQMVANSFKRCLYLNNTNSLSFRNLHAIGSSSSFMFLIILLPIIILVFVLIYLIAHYVKKYKTRTELSDKQNGEVENIEIGRFIDSLI